MTPTPEQTTDRERLELPIEVWNIIHAAGELVPLLEMAFGDLITGVDLSKDEFDLAEVLFLAYDRLDVVVRDWRAEYPNVDRLLRGDG